MPHWSATAPQPVGIDVLHKAFEQPHRLHAGASSPEAFILLGE